MKTGYCLRGLLAGVVLAVAGVPLSAFSGFWSTEKESSAQFKKMQSFYSDAAVRAPGTPGNMAMEEKVARLFEQSGLVHGEMRFEAPVFLPGETQLTAADLGTLRVYPMHPTLMRPGNFKEKSFSANLVYFGRGSVEEIQTAQGHVLDGAIAVLEYDCHDNWLSLMRFGLKGFLFLASDQYLHKDSLTKVYGTEVAVPRFFVQDAESERLRDFLKEAEGISTVQVEAEPSRWANKTLRNLWVLVPGADERLAREVVVMVAPLDSNSVVPEMATGAQSAANLHLLLQMFEQFKENRPARTVLFAVVNAHTQGFLGERMLAWNLLSPRPDLESVQDLLASELRVQDLMIKQYQKFSLQPPTQADSDFVVELRTLVDNSTGRYLTIKDPLVGMIKRDINIIKSRKIKLTQNQSLDRDDAQAKIDVLNVELQKYVHLITLFNKVGIRTEIADLTEEELRILKGYVDEIIRRNKVWSDLNRQDLDINSQNMNIRTALEGRVVQFVLNLELAWTGREFGFWSNNFWGTERWAHRWGQNVAAIASQVQASRQALMHPEEAPPVDPLFVDAMTKRGGLPEGHFFDSHSPAVSFFQAAGRTPAFALRNAYSDYGAAFSPADVFSKLDHSTVGEVMGSVVALFRAMLDDPGLTASGDLKQPGATGFEAIQIKTFKFDELSASVVPELPVPHSVALVYPAPLDAGTAVSPIVAGDVVNVYSRITDARAASLFFGLVAGAQKTARMPSAAFHLDSDFITVDHAIDAGESEAKISSDIIRGKESIIVALFECREIPVYTRDDPSLIGATTIFNPVYHVLSGRLNSSPRRFGLTGAQEMVSPKTFPLLSGPASFFIEPSESLKLLTATKCLVLNISEDEPDGAGFSSAEQLGPDFFARAVYDMAALNHSRLAKMRGISDELATGFIEMGDRAVVQMETAREANRHLDYLQSLYRALGGHRKAYTQITGITNDMLKAVVFYMALMLPFCFFFEKLIFKFVKIEAEMLMFGILFVATFMIFRMIHPAFRIAETPGAIFVAFVMGGLGLFVVQILHGRFEGEMKILFRTYSGVDTAGVGYSTVGQEAMLIGVNNMKRRRLRTTFTTATIVLVTFTMLAFTSISKKLSPTIIGQSEHAPYTGFMYHWPGNSRMDEATLRVLHEMFDGRSSIVERRWLMPPSKGDQHAPFRVFALTSGQSAQLDGVLGLSVAENGFLAPIPLHSGSFFSSDDAEEVVLPRSLALALGVDPDLKEPQKLLFKNHELEIVGVLDDEDFRMIRDINQRPILPIKALLQQADGDSGSAEESMLDETGVFYVDMSSLLILPLATAQQFGAEPYSASIRLNEGIPLWDVVEDMLVVSQNSRFYISSEEPFSVGSDASRKTEAGVYYVGEGYRTSIGGLSFLIIPLLIAATIILNTMLGSVFERKAEIAVYNAVGLNPTHIGMFFLAESFVYSVIGSVGGYLIGQILSILLTKTGIIEDINLNFSSLTVVYVILFTVAIVLLSTIYPSMVATKAAIPSGKRKWSLPSHDGQTMNVIFPFVYQPDLILGVLGYLEEYFSRFTEASFGDLIASLDETKSSQDAEGRPIYSLHYHLALAPFDLGVTQKAGFTVSYDDRVQAYRIAMRLDRVSGQDTNWATTNKPFLEKMRTYLLHWRNLNNTEHAMYVQRGEDLFAKEHS